MAFAKSKFATFEPFNRTTAPAIENYQIPTYDYQDITYPETLLAPQSIVQPIDEKVVADPEIAIEEPKERRKFKKVTRNPKLSIGQKVVDLARTFVGQPYVWGGKNPKQGFDCSGLISYAYKQNGIDIPVSTSGMFKMGKEVSLENAQVGDIICTPGTGATGRHVKMISKVDNGQIYTIEAKGKKWGIVEEPLKKTNNIITIRRVV